MTPGRQPAAPADLGGPQGLEVLEVDLGPRVLAGFTLRGRGGSPAPWPGLNLGLHVGDDPVRVAAHRARVQRWVGAPVAYADQRHGALVHRVDAVPTGSVVAVADALVTTRTDVAVAVLVADCVPVLLADPAAGVVAAVHAGRRGLVAGVLQAALAALEDAGADLSRTRAVVGPAIDGAAYEVPADLQAEVAELVPEAACTTAWGTPGLDLPGAASAVLMRAGVAVHRVAASTWSDPRLYSYRRARDGAGPRAMAGATGRFAGVVRLLDAPRVVPVGRREWH